MEKRKLEIGDRKRQGGDKAINVKKEVNKDLTHVTLLQIYSSVSFLRVYKMGGGQDTGRKY